MQHTEKTESRYIPALDGLRAFAVLAVIAYHMSFSWAQGGLLGVTVFFVLSGYLITSLLLVEFDDNGSINLPQFWLRRVRRLVPAIVFCVVGTAALCVAFNHVLLTKMRPDILPSLLFFNNWWQIFHNVSYFDALGSPSPLTHFWSLAIEEQFYLIWPPLLLLALKFGANRVTVRRVVLALAVVSALAMALLYSPTVDPSRVYYGTDTRAFSLLIGAWLAFAWPSRMLGSHSAVRISRQVRLALDGVGIAALVGLFAMVAMMNGFTEFPYRGGVLLCSILTAIIIAVLVHPASLLGRVLGCAPLVWIGKRSYSMYLWHYPILLLTDALGGMGDTPLWLYPLQLALIVLMSAFSYTFIENPIRHGAIGNFVADVREGYVYVSDWLRDHIIPLIAGVAVVTVAVVGCILVPETQAIEGTEDMEATQLDIEQRRAALAAQAETPKYDILLVGDSVSLRAVPQFNEKFPYGWIDSAVNRRMPAGQETFQYYEDLGVVGDVVVVSLGTNGMVTQGEMDSFLEAAGADRQVFIINARCDRSWEQPNNALFDATAAAHENVHLINWYGASAGRDDLFEGDGIHLNNTGAQFYVDMIYDAVASYLPEHSNDEVTVAEAASVRAARTETMSSGNDALLNVTQSLIPQTRIKGKVFPLDPEEYQAKQAADANTADSADGSQEPAEE